MGLLFLEHPKAQPEGGFRRSPGSNLRPLVYKASDLTTAPRRLSVYYNGTMGSFKVRLSVSSSKYIYKARISID